jgi:hypothetical protein
MNLLPLEIVHHILQYDGKIKYRNGKYMNQIATDDDRYKILQTIPLIQPHYDSYGYDNFNFFYIKMTSHNKEYYLYKQISPYLGENPFIYSIFDTREDYYVFITEGIKYKWTKYKPPPTFIEFLLQNLYNLCDALHYVPRIIPQCFRSTNVRIGV